MSPKQLLIPVINYLIIGVVIITSVVQVKIAYAAALTTLSDTQSTLTAGALSDHTIQFVTPTGIAAGQGIAITFPAYPTGYATGTFAIANFDFATSTSATCSGFTDALLAAGAASGLTWGVTQGASSTIYITSGTAVVPANRCVQIRIGSNAISQASGTAQITNPTSATTTAINITSSFGDNGSIMQNIITSDTVSVSATVQQSISFVISTTTIYFGALSSTGPKFASSTNSLGDAAETIAHTLQVTTNAPSGYTISIRGQTLTSQQNSANTITAIGASVASSSLGTEQFGIRATSTGGTGATIDTTFGALTSYGYDATATTSATFATGSGATNQTTFGLRYVANIAGTTEAGTYVASIVYVATANY
jgi:hypothetical protein